LSDPRSDNRREEQGDGGNLQTEVEHGMGRGQNRNRRGGHGEYLVALPLQRAGEAPPGKSAECCEPNQCDGNTKLENHLEIRVFREKPNMENIVASVNRISLREGTISYTS